METCTIYHNPSCSKCRQTEDLAQKSGTPYRLVPYLDQPPQVQELRQLATKLKLRPKDMLRTSEPLLEQMQLDLEDDDAVFLAISQNPRLLQRPIVVRGDEAVIARPAELAKRLLS